MTAQGVVLAFLALYVPLVGWRLRRRLGLYLVALYVLSQVPPLGAYRRVCLLQPPPAHSLSASLRASLLNFPLRRIPLRACPRYLYYAMSGGLTG